MPKVRPTETASCGDSQRVFDEGMALAFGHIPQGQSVGEAAVSPIKRFGKRAGTLFLKIGRGELGGIFQSRMGTIKELLKNHSNPSPSVKEWILFNLVFYYS